MTLPSATEKGFDTARELVQEFASDLLDEAGRVARRYGAESASAEHVRSASEHLYRSGQRWWQQTITSLAGIAAGGGGTTMVTFLQKSQPDYLGVYISAFVMIMGAVGVTLGLKRR